MKQIRSTLALIGWGLLIASVLLSLLHFRHGARFLFYSGIYLFLVSTIIALFQPKNTSVPSPRYNDLFNRYKSVYTYLSNVGALIMLTGLIFKMMHFPAALLLVFTGVLIIFVFYVLLLVLEFTKKPYIRTFNDSAVEVIAEDMDNYAGSYYNEQLNTDIKIWREDNRLNAQLTGQATFVLSAVKRDVFNDQAFGVVIEFYPEKHELVLIQHGNYLPFVKMRE